MANEIMNTDEQADVNVTYIPATIEIRDFEKLQQFVTEYASKYQNLVFTAENVKTAKSVRTELRKIERTIDDRRKDIKKQINQPLDEFEAKIKVLTKVIKDTVAPIDAGIKEIENAEKAEKQKAILAIVEEIAEDRGVNSFRIIIDAKWSNKTTSEATIRAGVAEQVEKLVEEDERKAKDIAFIEEYSLKRGIDSAGWSAWIALYNQGASVTEVISQIDAAEERKRAEEERRRAEEATAKIKAEQQQRYKEGVQQTIEVASAAPEQSVQEILTEIEESAEPIRVALLELRGTKTQFEALNQYMKEYEIFVKRHKCAGDPQ
ncbi:DUF1351 domain-containing protein [Listeria booriae]|uniref:DUF1351 domain-containing protein n=1 Tax=Listeria booriae TaxID=1552123 RepID=UPI00164ED91A|nr:DUF1351 domain-containing protein [Listeria booriae]MBC6163329.1 DUF1351 domain-containing protein [Listeria booriae]